MRFDGPEVDYEPVTGSRAGKMPRDKEPASPEWAASHPPRLAQRTEAETELTQRAWVPDGKQDMWSGKPGHLITYALLILYTTIAYFRPWDLSPTFAWMALVPYWLALTMLGVFAMSQFMMEGNLTSRPREVNLMLLLVGLAILSIPQAISPADAWKYFNGVFVKTVIVFLVVVNVLRTRRRLQGMMFISLLAGCYLSAISLTNSLTGKSVNTFRAKADIFNIFSDPNALALYLVMMLPIASALFLATPIAVKKLVYGAGILLMVTGTFATLSRGGFLAMVAAAGMFAFKLSRRNRPLVLALALVAVMAAAVLAPDGYSERLSSIVDPSRDPVGSATARRALLYRSIAVAIRRPILGVGIGNFQIVSIHNQVTHNSYTQVAAEMGLAALVIYVMFLLASYKRLRQIENETLKASRHSRFYYLSVGLQASLVGYMVGSFFLSVAFEWFVYFPVAYAICLSGLYQAEKLQATERQVSKYAGATPSQAAAPVTH